MELMININLDNAAFEDDPGAEVARILHNLAASYEERGHVQDTRTLRDRNGNTVGSARVE